jgi:hypothetical protein
MKHYEIIASIKTNVNIWWANYNEMKVKGYGL